MTDFDYFVYFNNTQFMNKTKKPQFKNPFDLQEDEQIQIMPVETVKTTKGIGTVHNPLPFNPYSIEKQSPKQQKKQAKTKQPQYVPEVIQQPSKKIIKPMPTPTPFYPQQIPTRDTEHHRQQRVYQLDQNGDPPLLEDIGIQPDMIKNRIKMILKLAKPSDQVIEDPDLSGPILIALCFGILLLLSGKIHFGDIYAIFVIGNFLLYFLFNFMSQVEIIPLYSMMSTLGYALLPMLILGFFGIFTSMKGTAGIILSLGISGWSSLAASNFVEAMMKQTNQDRKPLLIYPLFLFYVSFAMIIIF